MKIGIVTQQITESQIRALMEMVTRENTAYFLDRLRFQAGVRSLEDEGVRYCPDEAGSEVMFLDAASLLDHGIGSCGSIATYEAGRQRALAVWSGVASGVAAKRFSADLIPRPNTQGVQYFHAVVRTPSGHDDPTRRLQQVCVSPTYA